MMNQALEKAGKEIVLNRLLQCTVEQKHLFKRMYAPRNIDCSIEDAVLNMDASKIDQAISQIERTIKKNLESHP